MDASSTIIGPSSTSGRPCGVCSTPRRSTPPTRSSAAGSPSYLWAARDEAAGVFRLWYQGHLRRSDATERGGAFRSYIAYAESKDGVKWTRPNLGLFPSFKLEPNNVVLARKENTRLEASAPCLLELPERDRRGFRYVMLYRNKGPGGGDLNGIRLIGSHDGIRWDSAGDTRIAHLHSDTHNTVSYDPLRKRYVMFCRPKHVYRTFRGGMLDTGASRRVARLESKKLWADWLQDAAPRTVLVPDEADQARHYNFFYGMPARYYGGVFWGFLEPFRMNDFVHTEIAASRDGEHFIRPHGRTKLIEYGEEGAWDDTMIFASPGWVEVGDEWWIYYAGWDGPHGTAERTGAIGLATIRKEGFASLRGPRDGGVVCTRVLRWPGGTLAVTPAPRRAS